MSDPTATSTGAEEPHPEAVAASEVYAPDAEPEPAPDADSGDQGDDEPTTTTSADEAIDAGGAGQPFVGTDPIYENAANPTERAIATPDEFVSPAEKLTNEITADRAKRDGKIGAVTGYTSDPISADRSGE